MVVTENNEKDEQEMGCRLGGEVTSSERASVRGSDRLDDRVERRAGGAEMRKGSGLAPRGEDERVRRRASPSGRAGTISLCEEEITKAGLRMLGEAIPHLLACVELMYDGPKSENRRGDGETRQRCSWEGRCQFSMLIAGRNNVESGGSLVGFSSSVFKASCA